MNKERLIEALETALAELKQPTITFTPPKREPLSDYEILKLCPYADEISEEAFYRGARQIEKAHGIGGGE